MSYIITDDKHYKNIAKSLRSKLRTDRKYGPSEMATAIASIPSSADGTDKPIGGIYFLNPDENGNPTEIKVVNLKGDTSPIAKVLTNNNIRNSVKKITFVNCSINKINDDDFSNLINLEEFIIPDGVPATGWRAFSGCESLRKIVIPEGVKSIEQESFYKCRQLEELYFPKGTTFIGFRSLENCTSLKTVFFPNTITNVHTTYCWNLPLYNNPILEDGFNCDRFNLVPGTLDIVTRETLLKCLISLADRTGLTPYTIIIGNYRLKKLTEEDKLIAFNKNWKLS